MGSMKVHQYTCGFWEHEPFLTLGCKRLCPLAPKLPNTTQTPSAFDLKSFIRPECDPRKPLSSRVAEMEASPSNSCKTTFVEELSATAVKGGEDVGVGVGVDEGVVDLGDDDEAGAAGEAGVEAAGGEGRCEEDEVEIKGG